ncbi:MAG: YkgJ family cysteine cluster protein [Candidatus Sungbacteria bacterium]|uniref:YkgJ family cysteine cluster protein n=1 Tax=Candidatus Sungiibacteriota bacterium TaxID=2750080 RepID=A0A932R1L1_9BACT|nr:YkgJ family cysteine cluster protein [Candidatus Sungbacteria bacterium]
MSRDKFRETVSSGTGDKTEILFKTLADYQAQEYTASAVKPACGKHCSLCCHQLVDATPGEIGLIWRYLRNLPYAQKKKWRGRLQRAADAWNTYILQTPRLPSSTDLITTLKGISMDWRGTPCPFLEDNGACGIYEVRPLPCRTTTSPIRCGSPADVYDGMHARQCRYQSEQWAVELCVEECTSDDTLPVAFLIQFISKIKWREL